MTTFITFLICKCIITTNSTGRGTGTGTGMGTGTGRGTGTSTSMPLACCASTATTCTKFWWGTSPSLQRRVHAQSSNPHGKSLKRRGDGSFLQRHAVTTMQIGAVAHWYLPTHLHLLAVAGIVILNRITIRGSCGGRTTGRWRPAPRRAGTPAPRAARPKCSCGRSRRCCRCP